MGKLACDIVLISLAVSVVLSLLSIFLPWGGVESINAGGVLKARYFLLHIVVELDPKQALLDPSAYERLIGKGRPVTCPWNSVAANCYKFYTWDAYLSAGAWEPLEHLFSANGPTSGAANMAAAFYGGIACLLLLLVMIVLLLFSGCHLFQYCYSLKVENRGKRKWRRLSQMELSFAVIANLVTLVAWQITLMVMTRDVGMASFIPLVAQKGNPIPAEGWILSLFNFLLTTGILLTYKTWRSPSAEAAQTALKFGRDVGTSGKSSKRGAAEDAERGGGGGSSAKKGYDPFADSTDGEYDDDDKSFMSDSSSGTASDSYGSDNEHRQESRKRDGDEESRDGEVPAAALRPTARDLESAAQRSGLATAAGPFRWTGCWNKSAASAYYKGAREHVSVAVESLESDYVVVAVLQFGFRSGGSGRRQPTDGGGGGRRRGGGGRVLGQSIVDEDVKQYWKFLLFVVVLVLLLLLLTKAMRRARSVCSAVDATLFDPL
eukprot:g1442.t1